jgi:hypothetical protein
MPYRDDATRTRKYELAVIPANVSAKFTALLPFMQDLQESTQAQIVAMEVAIRQKLDDKGILGVARVPYLNFGRALFRAKGAQSGLALRKVASAEKAKFVAYGLDSEILDEIIYFVIGQAAYAT